MDLGDRKHVAPVCGAHGPPALLVGRSLPAPLVGLKCFARLPLREQKCNFIKMEGREIREQGIKPTLAGQFSVETCPEKGTSETQPTEIVKLLSPG